MGELSRHGVGDILQTLGVPVFLCPSPTETIETFTRTSKPILFTYQALRDQDYANIGESHTTSSLKEVDNEDEARAFGLLRECGLRDAPRERLHTPAKVAFQELLHARPLDPAHLNGQYRRKGMVEATRYEARLEHRIQVSLSSASANSDSSVFVRDLYHDIWRPRPFRHQATLWRPDSRLGETMRRYLSAGSIATWTLGICGLLWTFFGLRPETSIGPGSTGADLLVYFLCFSLFLVYGGLGFNLLQNICRESSAVSQEQWKQLLKWGLALVLFQVSVFVVGLRLASGSAEVSPRTSVAILYALIMWCVSLVLVFRGYAILEDSPPSKSFNSYAG